MEASKSNAQQPKTQPAEKIVNKGTGAGGSNTNKTGLKFEDITHLATEFQITSTDKFSKNVQFLPCDTKIFKTPKTKNSLFKCMGEHVNKDIQTAHGCKQPDESYIHEVSKTIFIIEKKFQQCTGSVCEKIQSPDFKIWHYGETFPEYKIVYIYCLSDWFKTNCASELRYLAYKNVPVFWGNDPDYKGKMVDFLVNYK